jgi:hypothetical protein
VQELEGELDQETGGFFYVKEKLSPILNAEPKPNFLGAVILDSVMNFNRSKNSQKFPEGFNTVKKCVLFCYLFIFTLKIINFRK